MSAAKREGTAVPQSLIVAGVMSGTSADGVDVAVCRISAGGDGEPRVKVLGHRSFPYTKKVREAVLAAMNAKTMSVAEMSRLNWRLGAIYAECVAKTCAELEVTVGTAGKTTALSRETPPSPTEPERVRHLARKVGVRLGLVGMHGQTVYHQATAARYLGTPVRCTWQIGEAAVVAERLGSPVVSDFRPADMAAGGQGAPLVPMLDFCVFRSAKVGRVLQNLGGIGNLTAIPAGASADKVLAFDTGPGNMVIDHCMRSLFGKEFDRGGAIALRGRVFPGVVDEVLKGRYFAAPPPKSCGREEFGSAFAERFVQRCRAAGAGDADVVTTATALTARSVLEAYTRFVRPRMGADPVEYAVAGGGAKNAALMRMLGEGLKGSGVRIRPIEELGVAAEAKEAVAFALLAWLTWQERVGNVPAATGALRGVVLGKVCLVL